MSGRWQRTFEIAVPLDTVWEAFTDPEYRRKLFAPPQRARDPGHDGQEGMRVLEVEDRRLLRWEQARGDLPERSEYTVTFEERERGSRITVTRTGFGEGDVADIFSESNALGWEHGFMDLVFALETGQLVKRHYFGSGRSRMGMVYAERDWGIEVHDVVKDGFGDECGLARGDRLVSVGDAPVFKRSDVWMLNAIHEPGTELEVRYVRDGELRTGRGRTSSFDFWAVGE